MGTTMRPPRPRGDDPPGHVAMTSEVMARPAAPLRRGHRCEGRTDERPRVAASAAELTEDLGGVLAELGRGAAGRPRGAVEVDRGGDHGGRGDAVGDVDDAAGGAQRRVVDDLERVLYPGPEHVR